MIVFRRSDGKFLLVHKPRDHHAWQFPQGGVETGEDLVTAAKRELTEELGTDKFQGFFKSSHVLFYDFPPGSVRDDKATGHKQSYFLIEFTGDDTDIALNKEELDEYRWVYQTELDEYVESKEYLQKLHLVIQELRSHMS